MEYPHQPVLVHQVADSLVTTLGGIYVDGTVGSGGHSEAIGKKIGEKGRLICLDRDPDAVRISQERLVFLGERVTVIKANYVDLAEVLKAEGLSKADGVLLDLGLSSYQLEHSSRGFSFQRDECLDMRMDPEDEVTAYQLINNASREELERILREYGEEKRAKSIAKRIEKERKLRSIDTSRQLATLIKSVVFTSHRPGAKHPATRTFQAIRIAVNRELDNLKRCLDLLPAHIEKGGRLAVLSYHSLEDRVVKQTMMNWEKSCRCPPEFPVCACDNEPLFKRLYKKGKKPDEEEIKQNPRARSAILRVAERT